MSKDDSLDRIYLSSMFSNRDIKRVRDEFLRDAEDLEDEVSVVRARTNILENPSVPGSQLATTPPSPPRSPEGRSLMPRLDKPSYREDISIFNWKTREKHEENVRRFEDGNGLQVPTTRQYTIHPSDAQSSVAVDVPIHFKRMTSRWSDDMVGVRTSDMDM